MCTSACAQGLMQHLRHATTNNKSTSPAEPNCDHDVQHNIPTRSRAERRQLGDREALERARLAARREAYHAYTDPGGLVVPDASDNALYLADADRFVTDVAAEQKFLREQAAAKKQAELLRRREQVSCYCWRWPGPLAQTALAPHVRGCRSDITTTMLPALFTSSAPWCVCVQAVERDAARWAAMEEQARAFEERTRALQAQATKAAANRSGVPLDPFTTAYQPGPDGATLQYIEEATKHRLAQRAATLYQRSSGNGNPLTGAPPAAAALAVPPPPAMPTGVSTEKAMQMSLRQRVRG